MSKDYFARHAIIWTQDKLIEIAKQFETRSKFKNGRGGAYYAAHRLGIIDLVCAHMGAPYVYDGSKERKSVYAIEFWDKSIYIGLSNAPNARLHEHLASAKGVVAKHFAKIGGNPPIMTILKNNLTDKNASLFEIEMVQHYKDQGRSVLNIAKAGALGGGRGGYTNKELMAIAAKFSSRSEFKKSVQGAYNAANKRGILEKCCTHMEVKYRRWAIDDAIAESKKYNSRKEWELNNRSSYIFVCKAGRLDEAMPSTLTMWDIESAIANGKRFASRYEWQKENNASYQFVRIAGRLDDVMPSKRPIKKRVISL